MDSGATGRIPTAGRSGPNTPAEFIQEALFAGLLGGSAVALFFLVVDVLDGQPYFTPSLIGSVLFQGAAAEDVTGVSLDAVASFSVLHVLAFTALGGAVSFLVHEVELHSRHPVMVLLVVFAIIEASFFLVAPLAMPGVLARLGMVHVGAANLLAAGTMALFFVLTHRAKPWQQLKHAKRKLILDSLNSGVLGGSVMALFFLVLDLMDGQALFTPALIGSVLSTACRQRTWWLCRPTPLPTTASRTSPRSPYSEPRSRFWSTRSSCTRAIPSCCCSCCLRSSSWCSSRWPRWPCPS